jgi:hypothetical protein
MQHKYRGGGSCSSLARDWTFSRLLIVIPCRFRQGFDGVLLCFEVGAKELRHEALSELLEVEVFRPLTGSNGRRADSVAHVVTWYPAA